MMPRVQMLCDNQRRGLCADHHYDNTWKHAVRNRLQVRITFGIPNRTEHDCTSPKMPGQLFTNISTAYTTC